MTRNFLVPLVLFYIALLTVLLGYIFSSELYKKRDSARKRKWLENAGQIIRNVILPEEVEITNALPDNMKKLENPRFRKFILQILVEAKQNLARPAANQLQELYLKLNMKQDSLQKLNGSRWQEMVGGIHELAIMGQKDQLEKIFQLTNHENLEVRMESQSAVIELVGLEGLRFLDIARHPISDWQQMKLLHQLFRIKDEKLLSGMKRLSGMERWLRSSNASVVVFSLKIIRIYKLDEHYPLVFIHCLHNASKHIRTEALKILMEGYPEMADTLISDRFDSKVEKSTALLETSDPHIAYLLDDIKEI